MMFLCTAYDSSVSVCNRRQDSVCCVVAVKCFLIVSCISEMKRKIFSELSARHFEKPYLFGKLWWPMEKPRVTKTITKKKHEYQIRGQKDIYLLLISKELSVMH